MEKIKIDTEYIKLDQFLKYASVVQSGGDAKNMIKEALVEVNNELVIQRGKKLRKDDIVKIEGVGIFIVV